MPLTWLTWPYQLIHRVLAAKSDIGCCQGQSPVLPRIFTSQKPYLSESLLLRALNARPLPTRTEEDPDEESAKLRLDRS